jgi:hypothetical protein
MGYVKAFIMDNDGAGWVDLSDLPDTIKLDLEIALLQEGAL